jgi:hypothetical protein
MPHKSLIFALATALLLAPVAARADSDLAAYDAARQALLVIWAGMPLTIRNATLTEREPAGYGDYAARDGNSYAPGDTIHVYAEVLGYGWRDNGDGTVSKLLDADLSLLNANGDVVASKQKFLSTDARSRQKLMESDLAFNITLSAFAPGDYKLRFAVHDRAGNKDASFDLPVTLVAGPASSAPPDAASAPSSEAASSSAAD